MSLPPPRRPLKSRSLRRRRENAPSAAPAAVAGVDDSPSITKLLRSLLGLVVVGAILGGGLWFYMKGMKQSVRITENINNGLSAVAAEIWADGMTPRIEDIDSDLILTFMELKKKADGNPPRVVVVEDPDSGFAGRRVTHQIMYMLGRRMMITLKLFYDPETGGIEILEYELGPDFQNVMKDYRAKKAARSVPPVTGEPSPVSDTGKPVTGDQPVPPGNPPVPEDTVPAEEKPPAEENPIPGEKSVPEEKPATGEKSTTEENPATEDFPAVK